MKVQSNTDNSKAAQQLCAKCGNMVSNLNKHTRGCHIRKTWGCQCPLCKHFEGKFDKAHMIKRPLRHKPSLNIEDTKFEVPSGYDDLKHCNFCKYSCLDDQMLEDHLRIHKIESKGESDNSFSHDFEQLLNDTSVLLQNSKLK